MTTRRTLWLLYTAFIVYGGLIPFHFSGDATLVAGRLQQLQITPLLSIGGWHQISISDAAQNVLLYLPFGALGLFSMRRTSRKTWRTVFAIVGLGFALAVVIELLQLFTLDRTTSATDVVFNTAGASLGAAAAWLGQGLLFAGSNRLRAEGMVVPELHPVIAAIVTVFVAWCQPFDVTLDVSTTIGKLRSLQADVWQFTGIRDEGTSIILGVFLATTLASYLSVLGERKPALKAASIAVALVAALETSQLIISSRMTSLCDLAVATLGIGIGIAIWKASTIVLWPRLWLTVITLATALAAGLQMLRPFEFTPAFHTMGLFPFLGYYSHTTFEALSHVVELMLLYFPLGFWLGSSDRSRARKLFWALGVTLLVALPIEYLQGWVVGRYPDITDVGISLCGAWVGVWAAGAGASEPGLVAD